MGVFDGVEGCLRNPGLAQTANRLSRPYKVAYSTVPGGAALILARELP